MSLPDPTSKSWRRYEGSKHFWILLVPQVHTELNLTCLLDKHKNKRIPFSSTAARLSARKLHDSGWQTLPSNVSSNFAFLAGQHLLQLLERFPLENSHLQTRLSWCRKKERILFSFKPFWNVPAFLGSIEKLKYRHSHASALLPSWFQVPALKPWPDCCTPGRRFSRWPCERSKSGFVLCFNTPHLIFVTREDACMMFVLHDQQACSSTGFHHGKKYIKHCMVMACLNLRSWRFRWWQKLECATAITAVVNLKCYLGNPIFYRWPIPKKNVLKHVPNIRNHII